MSTVEHEQALFCFSCSLLEFLILCGCDGQAVRPSLIWSAAWKIASRNPIVNDVVADFESLGDFAYGQFTLAAQWRYGDVVFVTNPLDH